MAAYDRRATIVSRAALEAVPFPVEPAFRMRPGLERCADTIAELVRPVSPRLFGQAQAVVEHAVDRARLPLVMTFEGRSQRETNCLAGLEAARQLLTNEAVQAGPPAASVRASALRLRRSLQDDFVLMLPDDERAQEPGMLRAAVTGVAAPSGWDPARVLGQDFAQIHQPVADASLIQNAAAPLSRLMLGKTVWRRFVWTLTGSSRLSQHPDDTQPVTPDRLADVWFRCERQLIVPLTKANAVVFLIRVFVAPLSEILSVEHSRATLLCQSLQSMSPAVVEYKNLAQIRHLVLAELPDVG